MTKRKITRSFLLNILIFMLTFPAMSPRVFAAEGKGTLTVYYHGVTKQGVQTALPGAEFLLYKAGEKVQGVWKLQGDFEGASVDLKDMSASGQRNAALQLYRFAVTEKTEGVSKITGDDGKAVFGNLEEGMYLCAAAGDVLYDNGIFRSAPFLVFLPETDVNGNCLYDVTVEPKSEWGDKEPQPEEPPQTQEPTQPEELPENAEDSGLKTGDDTDVRLYGIFLLGATGMIIIGRYKKHSC